MEFGYVRDTGTGNADRGKMSTALTIKKLLNELVPMDEAKSFLASVSDISQVANFTKAIEAAKMIDGKNAERRNYWGELAIWSTKRLGQLIIDGQKKGEIDKAGGNRKSLSHDAIMKLDDLGIKPDQSARAQKIAAIPDKTIKQYAKQQQEVDADQEVGKAGLLRFIGSGGILATKHGNDVIEWYTPPAHIEAVREVMGSIDCDPASSAFAQKTVQAGVYYTAKDSGLDHEWSGNVFLNPPFKTPLISQFVDGLCAELESGNVKQAILLTNNNTDTKWWHQAATLADAVCFTEGRIKFYNAAGEWSSPTNGQTLFYFGNKATKFTSVFASIGIVLSCKP